MNVSDPHRSVFNPSQAVRDRQPLRQVSRCSPSDVPKLTEDFNPSFAPSLLQLARICGLWHRHGYNWSFYLWPHNNQLHISGHYQLKGRLLSGTAVSRPPKTKLWDVCAALVNHRLRWKSSSHPFKSPPRSESTLLLNKRRHILT